MGFVVKVWLRWEEEMVSNDRGRRVVHYYVSDDSGGRDLAVIGREKSAHHMTYAVPNEFFHSLIRISSTEMPSVAATAAAAALPSDLKLRSRRQVVDWLSLLVSDSMPYGSSTMLDCYSDEEEASPANIPISKVLSSGGQMGRHSEEFSWIGSSWDCRKRRKHYQSFCRNGITISIHDFIYVLAEDNKRLVAYIEDLYEDMRTNNMVAVRWFHKVDEVSIVLPPDTNDREIFFSLCLQEFSVECIDGLAEVLGFEDFEKFQKEPQRYSSWHPYLCRRQIDSDEIKPYDITHIHGYWSQYLLRLIYPSYLKLRLKIKGHVSNMDENKTCFDSQGNCKKKHHSNSGCNDVEGLVNDTGKSKGLSVGNSLEQSTQITRVTKSSATPKTGLVKHVLSQQQNLAPGFEIELLSQDSGIRGCWFYCVVLKRHRDKIKVRYQDVHDADGTANLEEWVSTSRIAAPDKLGIRMCGRPMFRPCPSHKDKSFCSYEVGKVVDARWHDGWWEGIVISNNREGKIHVYLSGEQRVSIFCPGDLRPSEEWVENNWNHMKERPDIANLLHSELDREKCCDCITFQTSASEVPPDPVTGREKGDSSRLNIRTETCMPQLVNDSLSEKRERNALHEGLRWSSTRKRTRGRQFFAYEFSDKRRRRIDVSPQPSIEKSSICGAFLIPKSLKMADQENCKSGGGDPLFGAQMSICSNLVMTR